MKNDKPYDDILNLPHHQSKKHPHMSIQNRAAQFSPFAALTGYDDRIKEASRLTDSKADLTEEVKELLDQTLLLIQETEHSVITVTYFVPDQQSTGPSAKGTSTGASFGMLRQKEGGSYLTATGTVKKIDRYTRELILLAENGISDGLHICLDDIFSIDFTEEISSVPRSV